MGKKLHHSLKSVEKVPKGQPFSQLWLELYVSDAWRAMSINCRRLIDFLISEHLRHNGAENGFLMATYDQLIRDVGINRKFISGAIKEAEKLGLVHVEHGYNGRGYIESSPNIFTLTFLPLKVKGEGGIYYTAASNDWRGFKK
jgi:hypothetical protein